MNETETYEFICRCNNRSFQIGEDAPSRSLHMLLGVVTLGLWLVLYALYRMGHLYVISRCPVCGKRSRSVFWILLILLFFSAEFGRTLYFFLVSAPQQIVADASFAQLPEDLDLNAPLDASNAKSAFGFVWVTAALPAAGMFISTFWPYLILGWLSILTLIGLWLPSVYLKRAV